MTELTTVFLLALTLTGCASNDEIIRDTKECLDAGMKAYQTEVGITCVLSREQKP
jgi:uncharacterized protein YcfL